MNLRSRAFALTLAICLLPISELEARSWQDVRNAGVIRVGIALASPWVMRDSDGELIGFDVDVAERLASDMRVRPEFVIYEWDRLVQAIEADEIDIVVAGLRISPERALHVNFSSPYATGGVTLATNTAQTAAVATLLDLDDGKYTLGVVEGSVAPELAQRVLPRIEIATFERAEDAGRALIDGDIDAYLEEEPVPTFLALENPSIIDVPLSEPLLETPTGFAIGKGDPDFLAFLNTWIVSRTADTWLPTTYGYWFGSLRWRDRLSE